MNAKIAVLLLSCLLVACAQPQPPEAASPAPAQAAEPAPAPPQAAETAPVDRVVNILRADCQNLLTLAPEDRAAASMFYIGYQAARSRSKTINVGGIPGIQAQALAYCQDHPDRTVAQAFAQAYSRARR